MGKSTILMAIFNSYVKLPEGSLYFSHFNLHVSAAKINIQVNELPFFSAETLDGQQNDPGIQSWKKMRNVTFSLRRSEGTVPRLHSHVRYHIDQP